jgi:ketosteroid isomerase-like protein
MNLIQQAVERAKQLEGEGKVVAPVTQTGPRPESRVSASAAPTGPRIGLASLPHIEPVATRGPMPVLLVLLVCVLALGGGALLYFFLAKSQAIENGVVGAVKAVTAPATKTVGESANPAAAVPTVAATPPPNATAATAAPPAAAKPAGATAAPAAAALDEARSAVEGWARAWSDRNVDAYLGFYGEAFRPDRGQSRAAWEASRRQAIEKKSTITVSVRNLKLEARAGDRVTARFIQDYSADTYRENGTAKTLVLAREGTGWRIVSESAGAARGNTR